jgi:DNA-binding transcriptional LysR family regulator
MLDRVAGMQVFVRVAALGSFSAAARALGISQTMVTKHIGAIERRLDIKLLHRTTRSLTLTEAGHGYLEASERILAAIEEAEASTSAERLKAQGTLRMNVPVSFGVREIAPLMPAFARTYPSVTVELGLIDRVVELIEEGWDMAVRIGGLADSRMIVRKIAPCSTVLCASPTYLAEKGTPKTVDELIHHNCLGYTLSKSHGTDQWSFGTNAEVSVPIAGNLRASNGEALVPAAVHGQGLVYGPSFLVNAELCAGRLVAIELDHPTYPLRGVFAVYPPDRHPPAKVRAMIDFLYRSQIGLNRIRPWRTVFG